jgi:ABC-2 type transport system permease protein
MKKILYLVKKELLETLRQSRMLPLILLMPAIQIAILGYVMVTDIRNLPVEIVNLSAKRTAADIVTRVKATPQFRVIRVLNRPDDYEEQLRRGQVKAILLLRDPAGSPGRLNYPEIQVLMDGVDSNTALIAAGYFNGIVQNHILTDMQRRGVTLPLTSRPLIRYNPDLRGVNYMGPGMVALLLSTVLLFLGSMALVREREQQTMDTLLISPLNPLQIFIGKAVPVGLLGLVSVGAGLVILRLLFSVTLRGSPLDLLAAVLVYETTLLAYGLLISTLASTQQEAMFFAWFSMITFLLLSGFFTPVANIPTAIRPIVYINPTYYMMSIIRQIFLKGNGLIYFWRELAALGLISVVVTAISLRAYRRLVN